MNEFHVLVVDDDEKVRKLLARAIERRRCVCHQAADGMRALEMISANAYDVVVTDLRMPHLQGTTLISAILQLNDRPAVLVITGTIEQQQLRVVEARDIEGVFAKPIDPDQIADEVRAVAERRRALWQHQLAAVD
ncbi:MAG TPA: response regulator [Pirellulales bacterium]|nr:response regulator [Pirellulales bacterium]